MYKSFLLIPVLLLSFSLLSQDHFYFGNDLSYVNQMEDCGADFKENNESKDPFAIFADQETNLVRVRLWVDPCWWQENLQQPDGVKSCYSNLEDVKETIERAKNNGMEVMLGLHYSDFWSDPNRQLIPRQWIDVAYDTEALSDSVYQYTHRVLTELDNMGLMPDIVKVGNENNPGMMVHLPEEDGFEVAENIVEPNTWERDAQLFNAGIQAVRDVGATADINPKISLHWSNLEGLEWWYDNMISHGVTDFDIIGFSYYYAWHEGSIAALEERVTHMADKYPQYEVAVVETGYLWTEEYGGIINTPDPEYAPATPENQLNYMVDFTQAVMNGGGTGVIFWEPAWINTACVTPWITGSSHTGVAFFEPETYNFMENGGGKWTNRSFYEDIPDDSETVAVTFNVDMTGEDAGNGVYITGDMTGPEGQWEIIPMNLMADNLYSYTTQLPAGSEGAYYFLNDNDWEARETIPEACAEWWETDRGYIVPEHDTSFTFNWGSCEYDDDVVTSIDERKSHGLRLFPNPVENQLTIESPHKGHYTLFDLRGRILKTGIFIPEQTIPFTNIPKGHYIIWITTQHDVFVRKVIRN